MKRVLPKRSRAMCSESKLTPTPKTRGHGCFLTATSCTGSRWAPGRSAHRRPLQRAHRSARSCRVADVPKRDSTRAEAKPTQRCFCSEPQLAEKCVQSDDPKAQREYHRDREEFEDLDLAFHYRRELQPRRDQAARHNQRRQ